MATKTKTSQGGNNSEKLTAVKGEQKTKTDQKTKGQEDASVLSLDDRKHHFRQMSHLADQHEQLIEQKGKVDGLSFGSDQFSDELILRDGQVRTFTTSKTDVIEAVREKIREKVDERIKAVEAKIAV